MFCLAVYMPGSVRTSTVSTFVALCIQSNLVYVTICLFLFFFNDTATTEIYTLSLHDALPICQSKLSAWIDTAFS